MDTLSSTSSNEGCSLQDNTTASDRPPYGQNIIFSNFSTLVHQQFEEGFNLVSKTIFHHPPCACPLCLWLLFITTEPQPAFPIPHDSPIQGVTSSKENFHEELMTARHQLLMTSLYLLENFDAYGRTGGADVWMVDQHTPHHLGFQGLSFDDPATLTLLGHDAPSFAALVPTMMPAHADNNSMYGSDGPDIEAIKQPGGPPPEPFNCPRFAAPKLLTTIAIPQRAYVNTYGTRGGSYDPVEQQIIEFWAGDQPGVFITDMLKPKSQRPKLRNGNAPAFKSPKACASLRICWLGFKDWSEQFGTTNDTRTKPRRPITVEEAAHRVSNKVMRFFTQVGNSKFKPLKGSVGQFEPDGWWISPKDILPQNVRLISLQRASCGSWQPNLELFLPAADMGARI